MHQAAEIESAQDWSRNWEKGGRGGEIDAGGGEGMGPCRVIGDEEPPQQQQQLLLQKTNNNNKKKKQLLEQQARSNNENKRGRKLAKEEVGM